MAILLYITKLLLASGLLYGYYYLFLRNKQFHRYNRVYLLVAPVAALVIPFFNIPVQLLAGNSSNGAVIKTLRVITFGSWEEPVTIYANQNSWSRFFTVQYGLLFVYVAGVAAGLFLLLRSFVYINRIKKQYQSQSIDDIKFYNTDEKGTPFSFFRHIFWNNQLAFNSTQGQQIFRHELFHVKEKHSSDIVFMELLTSLAWFNPFFHLIKKEIKAIHEFLADEYAVSNSNRYEYAELLVIHAINQRTASLTHHFFHHQIKRRIAMITSSNSTSRKSGYLRRVMVLPLLFIVFCAFAVKLTSKKKNIGKSYAITTPITIVVDAGHGGIYPGAQSKSGIAEKDINLSIARMMKELSREYNINVVMTRSDDKLVGNATTLVEDLQNRVDISTNAKPDLFISIHVNSASGTNSAKSGFEAYISGKKEDKKSVEWASVLLTGLKNIYPAAETVRQNAAGVITVLDKNTCPAVLIECGYITNTADVAFISNQKNQEKVARNILESITKFRPTEQPAISVNAGPATDVVDPLAPVEMETFSTQDKNPQDSILSKVEIEADYPGGKDAWSRYLFKSIHYPQVAIDKEIKGTVIVQFVVNKEGIVSNVKAISGPKELREESVRVVKFSGKWEPGIQNGKKVNTYKKQPIIFQLERAEPGKTGKS